MISIGLVEMGSRKGRLRLAEWATPHASNFKFQISNFKSQISNFKFQISNLKSQIKQSRPAGHVVEPNEATTAACRN